jgi:hypothetical protein
MRCIEAWAVPHASTNTVIPAQQVEAQRADNEAQASMAICVKEQVAHLYSVLQEEAEKEAALQRAQRSQARLVAASGMQEKVVHLSRALQLEKAAKADAVHSAQ